jgi:hypothetical protein
MAIAFSTLKENASMLSKKECRVLVARSRLQKPNS